jgi:hypothetical protein
VMLNNTWQPDWDNVAFDLALKAIQGNSTLSTARISKITAQNGGPFRLEIAGSTGSRWNIETCLQPAASRWSVVQSVSLGASGTSTVDLPAITGQSAGYYRLTLAP